MAIEFGNCYIAYKPLFKKQLMDATIHVYPFFSHPAQLSFFQQYKNVPPYPTNKQTGVRINALLGEQVKVLAALPAQITHIPVKFNW
jgi:hypothetical protein